MRYGTCHSYRMTMLTQQLCQSFNEELDKMFNDVNLPADEAWEAMNSDLMKTKMERNNLAAENS